MILKQVNIGRNEALFAAVQHNLQKIYSKNITNTSIKMDILT